MASLVSHFVPGRQQQHHSFAGGEPYHGSDMIDMPHMVVVDKSQTLASPTYAENTITNNKLPGFSSIFSNTPHQQPLVASSCNDLGYLPTTDMPLMTLPSLPISPDDVSSLPSSSSLSFPLPCENNYMMYGTPLVSPPPGLMQHQQQQQQQQQQHVFKYQPSSYECSSNVIRSTQQASSSVAVTGEYLEQHDQRQQCSSVRQTVQEKQSARSSRSSSSRRRRRKFDKNIVRRNLNSFLLQKLMATHYPDKIYALYMAPNALAAPNHHHHDGDDDDGMLDGDVVDDDDDIDNRLELYVEWGALRYAPVHKSVAKKKVKTIKTVLPYSLMKKHYPEVVIRFFEEHLRLHDISSGVEGDMLAKSSSRSTVQHNNLESPLLSQILEHEQHENFYCS